MHRTFACAIALTAIASSRAALALDADPSNYTAALAALQPGDTLNLAPGTYASGLNVTNLNGTASAPITITGPATAVFVGRDCCNTVEITNSSFVVIRGITLDGQDRDGVFGVSAKGSSNNFTHHITIEGLTILHHGASQQTVGISTKTPTWGWVIRGNKILGAGTGLYLGNSNGDEAFWDGIIEGNLVEDSVGYAMQIKQQNPRPSRPGQPTTDARTLIRHNVFIKGDGPSPDGDRPNLLVDGFPDTGPGANDRYEIYGNLFFHNPRESLLQATGRFSIHDNVFVDVAGDAILVTNHGGKTVKLAYVYDNTIYAAGKPIVFGSAASEGDAVFGNLVFSDAGISGTIANLKDNLLLKVADAPSYVVKPSTTLGAMDFYPLGASCSGAALPVDLVTGDIAGDVDFNGTSRTPPIWRGAYAGSGTNPGWPLSDAPKPLPQGTPGDGGLGDSGAVEPDGGTGPVGDAGLADSGALDGAGGGPSAGAPASGAGADDAGGCGCRVGAEGSSAASRFGLLAAVAMLLGRRRRRHSFGPSL